MNDLLENIESALLGSKKVQEFLKTFSQD